MKIKNKGKVHPSPSSSSLSPPPPSVSSSFHGDSFSVLKLLPAAIFTLISALSFEDREVLAYMITRSLKTTTTPSSARPGSSSSLVGHDSKNKKKRSSKQQNKQTASSLHKPPVFDCDCFDCYTSYWFRWDSSPNRELIHQAIETFEDHLTNGEAEKSKRSGKKREKTGRRVMDQPGPPVSEASPSPSPENEEESFPTPAVSADGLVTDDTSPASSPELDSGGCEDEVAETPVVAKSEAVCGHKGLARKVLPDVLGLFNSRLWNLWSPSV